MSEAQPELKELIYDWNEVDRTGPVFGEQTFEVHDETLRDGIQNPSVVDPGIGDKIEMIHLLDELGVYSADVGLPGAGPRSFEDVLTLCKEIANEGLNILPGCAGRTMVNDIQPIAQISQEAGTPIEVMTFIGSSPIRKFAEDWSSELIIRRTAEAIDFGVKEGLPVTFVTEDTSRSHPQLLRDLFHTAIDHGATRLCLCDTVGHATPDGVRNLITFAKHIVEDSGVDVKIDWHGHNDRGLGLVNALFAFEHGAHRVHGTVLGIGERVGNTPIDLLLINLKLLGQLGDRNLSKLAALATRVSKATAFPIPINYPVVGEDAFRTATGVHAAAIIKAQQKGDAWLADRVYSGVPAGMFGRTQEICVGPMSGVSNVTHWLAANGVTESEGLVASLLKVAKQSDHNLDREEIMAVIERHNLKAHK